MLIRTFHLQFSKFDGTAAPGVSDDDVAGYVAGSLWADRTNHKIYVCKDNATGAAVWAEIPGAGGGGGSGTVTHTAGALTLHALVLGNAADDAKALGSLGTANTVLHGAAAGDPTWSAVDLAADVTGSLPNANLANSSVTVNGTAIALGAAGTVAAAAGTLTGATLAAGVLASSLTSVGTLATLTVTATITGSISGNAATVTTNANLTGDVTSVGNATTIGAGKVTLAMQANMATASVVYRKTAGSGAPEVNTLATLKTDLGLTGTNSGDQTITLTGGVTGSGTGSFAATVVTNANLTGDVTSVGNAATIAANAVTLAKMATMATASLLGRNTAGTGNVEVLSQSTALSLLGATTVGKAYLQLTDPSAVTFPRMNADNTVTALSAAAMLTALGGSGGSNPGMISGFRMSYGSDTTVVISKGTARDNTDAANIAVATAFTTVTATSNGAANGNDSFTGAGTVSYNTATGAVTGTGTAFLSAFGTRAMTGTITSSTTAVTGTGTRFLSEIALNDLIGTAAKGYFSVVAIASDTALTLNSTPASAFSGQTPNCTELPTLKPGTNIVGKVVAITTDTALMSDTGNGTQTGVAYTIGNLYPNFLYLHVASGGTGTAFVFSTQRTTAFSKAFGGSPGLTGYSTYSRRIGTVRINSSAIVINPFSQSGSGIDRSYQYEYALNTNNSRLLAAGAATAWTAVLASPVVPPTAVALTLNVLATGTSSDYCYLRVRGLGDTAVTRALRIICVGGGPADTIICQCDGAQAIDYATSNARTTLYIDTVGYSESLAA